MNNHSDPYLKKGLPKSAEAERAILGGIWLNNLLAGQAASLVPEANIYSDSNRRIYSAMLRLWKDGKPIDEVTLPNELRTRGELERVGGFSYLSSLIDGVPRTDTIEYYAGIVNEKALRRNLIALSERLGSKVYDGEDTVEAVIEYARRSLDSIESKPEKRKLIHADELDNEPPIEWLIENEIPDHSLIVLFGPSEAGKSFVALDYALCISQAKPVVYIAAEGGQGYGVRKRAWCEYHNRNSGNLYFWREAVSLLCAQAVDELIRAIRELKPALVVIDTLARCLVGGDENSAKDTGLVHCN